MTVAITGVNEHISTYDSAGGKDYSSLSTWEQATDNDLVTAQVSEVLECYRGVHNDSVQLLGAVTNNSYRRIIRCAPGESYLERNNGVPLLDGSCVAFSSATYFDDIIILMENYGIVKDIVISGTYSGTDAMKTLNMRGNHSVFYGCCVRDITLNGGRKDGIYVAFSGDNYTGHIINCLVFGCTGNGFCENTGWAGCEAIFENCTAYGNGYNFRNEYGSTATAKNCIAESGTIGNWQGTWGKTTCTNGGGVTFRSVAGKDFRLALSDTVAIDQGTDLSADFTADAFGTTRPSEVAWDIGFHEAIKTFKLSSTDVISTVDFATSVFSKDVSTIDSVVISESADGIVPFLSLQTVDVVASMSSTFTAVPICSLSVVDSARGIDLLTLGVDIPGINVISTVTAVESMIIGVGYSELSIKILESFISIE